MRNKFFETLFIIVAVLVVTLTILSCFTISLIMGHDNYVHAAYGEVAEHIASTMETDTEDCPCVNIDTEKETESVVESEVVVETEIPMETVSETYAIVYEDYINPPLFTDDVYDTLEKMYTSIAAWQSLNGESDFTFEHLCMLKLCCDKYNVPLEIMLSIICGESSFISTAVSDEGSSASGYCQIIERSAEWMYETVLEYGTYDADKHQYIMTTDWCLNFEIGCAIMRYNYDTYYNSWEYAIKMYHGHWDPYVNELYFQYINTKMYELFGANFYEIIT